MGVHFLIVMIAVIAILIALGRKLMLNNEVLVERKIDVFA